MSAPTALAPDRNWLPAGLLAAGIHVLFIALLVYSLQWQNHAAAPVQAELWNTLPPLPAAPPIPEVAPKPPIPPPESRNPSHAAPAEVPPPLKPAIVVEKARPDSRKPPEESSAERDKLAREEAALKKLDRQMREQASREQAEQQQREQAEEQRLANLQRSAEANQKQQNQAAQSRMLQGAADRIQAKIQQNTVVPPSVPSGITIVVKFIALPDGSVLDGSIHIVSSSGNQTYDDAVQRAIIASQPLPMPDDLALRRAIRDIKLTIHNIH
jgi:colicin import membrane protein